MSKPVLLIENLKKTYMLGKQPVNALTNLSMQVNQGEFISIMGPSAQAKPHCLTSLAVSTNPPVVQFS